MKDIEFTHPSVPGLEVVFMDFAPPSGVGYVEPQITGSVTAFFKTIDGDFELPLPPSLSDTFERVDEMWGFEVGTTQANFLKDPMNLRNIQGAITCSSEPLITRVLYEGVELFAFAEGVRLEDASFIVDRDLTKPAPGYVVEISPIAGGPLTEEEATDRRDRAIRSLSVGQMYALCWSLSRKQMLHPHAGFTCGSTHQQMEKGSRMHELLAASQPSWANPKPWLRKRKGGAA